MLAAARTDNEELLLEVFEEGKFDINFQDGCVSCLCCITSDTSDAISTD